jgi:hypothetical protein
MNRLPPVVSSSTIFVTVTSPICHFIVPVQVCASSPGDQHIDVACAARQPEQFLAFQEEQGRSGAPPLVSFGPTMAGPVIYTFGTPDQKKKYLGDIS